MCLIVNWISLSPVSLSFVSIFVVVCLQRLERKAEAMRAVVQGFVSMFDDEIDLYWLSTRFMKCLDQSASQLDKLVTILLS